MMELYEKIASTRWKDQISHGLMSAADKARLGMHDLSDMSSVTKRLSSFATDLTEQGLARYQQLQTPMTKARLTAAGGVHKNYPGVGPATLGIPATEGVPESVQTYVSPQTGTILRMLTEGNSPSQDLAAKVMTTGRNLPRRSAHRLKAPEDSSIYSSMTNHELAEAQMMRGFSDGKYPGNFFASHLGPSAIIAERVGQRDPKAHAFMDRARSTTGEDDPRAARLMRQHGFFGSSMPPLGGRNHRSLEKAIERMPVSLGEGGQQRLNHGGRLTMLAHEREMIASHPDTVRSTDTAASRAPKFTWKNQEDVRNHIARLSSL